VSDYGWSLVSVVTAPAPTPGSSGPAASAAVAPAGAARLSGYRPHLDGIRTVAVYLVVVFHAGADRLAGGFIGVDVFFVLSGYLVTQVLLRDVAGNRRVRFGRFYARRVRRLLPASAVALLGTAVVFSWVSSPVEVGDVAGGFKAAFLYSANWFFIGQASDYFAADQTSSPVLHFWSLAVEEQFYFVWPLAFAGAFAVARRFGRHQRRVVLGLVAAGGLASVGWAWHLSTAAPTRAYYGTDARAYQLLLGAALALAPSLVVRWPRLDRLAGAAAGGSLVLLCVLATSYVGPRPVLRGIAASLLTAGLIVALERADSPVRRFASWTPMVELGRISYGTYLWHWPVIIVLQRLGGFSAWQVAVLAVVLATGLAALSALLVELPIRRSGPLDRMPRVVVAGGLAVSLLCGVVLVEPVLERGASGPRPTATGGDGGLVLAPVPASFDQEAVHADHYRRGMGCDPTTGAGCTFNPGTDTQVVVLGDSNGMMLNEVLVGLATEQGFTLTIATAAGCPWQDDLVYPDHADTVPGCQAVHEHNYGGMLADLAPDLVIALNVREYWTVGVDQAPDEPRVDDIRVATEASADAILATGAQLLVIEPLPRTKDGWNPLTCLGTATYQEQCRFQVSDGPFWHEVDLRALAAENEAMSTLDLDRVVCPALPICDPFIDGIVVRWDGAHLSRRFGLTLDDDLVAAMRDLGVLSP
jgi:peptidoglycan/LPS O-acetylase OafA/YrhL